VPLIGVVALGYFARASLGKLGPDPALASIDFAMPKTSGSIYEEIGTLETEIDQFQAKIDEIPKLKKDLQKLSSMIEALRERLPKEVMKERMRTELEDIAREAEDRVGAPVILEGVWIDIPGGGRGGASGETEITYRLQFQANMNALIWYINEIENYRDRFMMVTQLTVTPGELEVNASKQQVDPGRHKINMIVTAYVYQEGG